MTTRRLARGLAILLLPMLALAACGDDDGGDVRNLGGEGSATGSGSASASGSGSASAPASGSASGSHVEDHAECKEALDPAPATSVAVSLDEFSIVPAVASAPAGAIGFVAENVGEEPHELAVVRAESVEAIPTTEDGAADLDALGDDVIGEIETFGAGETCAAELTLDPGSYVLLCNLVEGDEAHYRLGMRTAFTVTG